MEWKLLLLWSFGSKSLWIGMKLYVGQNCNCVYDWWKKVNRNISRMIFFFFVCWYSFHYQAWSLICSPQTTICDTLEIVHCVRTQPRKKKPHEVKINVEKMQITTKSTQIFYVYWKFHSLIVSPRISFSMNLQCVLVLVFVLGHSYSRWFTV